MYRGAGYLFFVVLSMAAPLVAPCSVLAQSTLKLTADEQTWLQGGTISLQNKPAVGLTFTVRLPLPSTAA